MKKEDIYKLLYGLAVFLAITCVSRVGMDFIEYKNAGAAGPFYPVIYTRLLTLVLPAVILFVIAELIRRKNEKK